MLWVAPLSALLIGYLLGAVPFGLLLTRLAGAGDLRAIGSGNIGATNVLRTGRKGLAALTLLLDAAKGAAAVLIAVAIGPDLGPLGGLAAFFGHCYPAWLSFRGGKGVATYLGILLALAAPVALVAAIVWLGAVVISRTSSVGGIAATVAAPIAAVVFGRFELAILCLACTLIVVWKHRANIARLRAGTEPKVSARGQ